MIEMSKKDSLNFVLKASGIEKDTNELVANNRVIGKESTLADVLKLLKKYHVNSNSDLEHPIRAYVVNRVLGGSN